MKCIYVCTIIFIIMSAYIVPVTAEVGDVLIRGASKSLTIGSSWDLEEGYAITFKDIDKTGTSALIEIKKNNEKVSGDIMKVGDLFDYEKNINDRKYTIISIKLTKLSSSSVQLDNVIQYSEGSYDPESTGPVMSFEIAQADDWPMFRHDLTHSGSSNETLNPPLEIKWKFQTGAGISSSPAISNGIVYIGSLDDYIYAINSNTGKLKWKFQTDASISSSPAVSNGIVYVGSGNYLYAIDATTGSLKWKYQTGYISSSPVVNEKTVYLGTYDGMIYALNAENGELKWKFQASRTILSSPAISSGIVYVGSGKYLYAIDAELGYLIWKKQSINYITSSPSVFGDLVYASDQSGYVYASDISTGASKWEYKKDERVFTRTMSSSPAILDGTLYVGSNRDNVYALNANTGALKWKYTSEIPKAFNFISSPVALKNIIYIGSADNHLYALDALTGTLKWKYQTSGKVSSSPSVSGGSLYVGSEDGYLYAFSPGSPPPILEIPTLISPFNGANMSNWHESGSVWDFDWSDVEDASEYQLYVKKDLAEYPIIDTTSTISSYKYAHTGTVYSRNYYGWTWKVRAKVNGQWSEWSEPYIFSVEKVNANSPTIEKSQLPIVNTNSAGSITSNSAILQGTVNPNGLSTQVTFMPDNSNTQSYFTSTPVQNVGADTSYQSVSYSLTGLRPSTTYSYYVSATNSAGTQNGGVVAFTTLVSCQHYNVAKYIRYKLHNQSMRIEYEEIHRDTNQRRA